MVDLAPPSVNNDTPAASWLSVNIVMTNVTISPSSHSHSHFYYVLFAGRGQLLVYAGNNAADGPFTPLVKAVRNVIGVKEFNQLRGKAISLHSQGMLLFPSTLPPLSHTHTITKCNAVIKDFCKQIGADNKQIQGLIRLAKKNGEKLGFLS